MRLIGSGSVHCNRCTAAPLHRCTSAAVILVGTREQLAGPVIVHGAG
jgi:hypothetical protein